MPELDGSFRSGREGRRMTRGRRQANLDTGLVGNGGVEDEYITYVHELELSAVRREEVSLYVGKLLKLS